MCFHSKQSKDAQTLEKRFNSKFKVPNEFIPPYVYNGFTHPYTPIITNEEPNKIQLYSWGLIPNWSSDLKFRKHTINARIETITEKPSYRNYTKNRCLILLDGFFEWQWLDEKGKNKQKYLLNQDNEAFAIAGLWNKWVNKETGEVIENYTLLTTVANSQMERIHNIKKRMPMILSKDEELKWLQGEEIKPTRDLIELNEIKL